MARPLFVPFAIAMLVVHSVCMAELNSAPSLFERPVVDPAGTFLVFAGDYRGGDAPWPSEYVTGVVGAVRADGALLFTLDVVGSTTDNSTEVTGLDVVDDGPTVRVIGNHASDVVTLGGTMHTDPVGLSCASAGSPCKPFLAKLTLTQQ